MPKNNAWTCDANCPARKGSIFEGLSAATLDFIAQGRTTNTYKLNEVIIHEDNEPYGVYHIRSGKVKLYKTGSMGRELITHIAQCGELLGVASLMSGKANFTSARALEAAQVCFIERSIFFTALKMDFRLADNVMTHLGGEVGHTLSRLESAVHEPVAHRVAGVLTKMLKEYGTAKDGSLNIQLTQAELSELTDTTQDTVLGTLKALEQKKAIALRDKKIVILQPEALKKEVQ